MKTHPFSLPVTGQISRSQAITTAELNSTDHAHSRKFDPVALGMAVLQPELADRIRSVRKNKKVRNLAKSAAYQFRHLADIAAFELYLNSAAKSHIEQGADPLGWLEDRISEIRAEQAQTRLEHAVASANLAALDAQRGGE